MVAPNPVDLLTSRVRHALGGLFLQSFTSAASGDSAPASREFSSLTDRQRYRLEVLAGFTFGIVSAPQLVTTAVEAALEWYGSHAEALESFEAEIRGALGGLAAELDRFVALGDLDASNPDLQVVKDAAEGRAARESVAPALEKALRLYRVGAHAPSQRLYEADCRTPYSVPVDGAIIYAALLRPYGYDEDEWEYDLGSLSPDLATLRRRIADGVLVHADDVVVGLAEVSLVPAASWEAGGRQTNVCDTAVRETGGVQSYDLHSFMASGAGICEVVTDYPIEPHPAGPIVGVTVVKLVLVREFPLEPGE